MSAVMNVQLEATHALVKTCLCAFTAPGLLQLPGATMPHQIWQGYTDIYTW